MEIMSKKKLENWQLEDAERLRLLWEKYKAKEDISQEAFVDQLGWLNQSAFSQYINGTIPLNLKRVINFARVFKVNPMQISPSHAEILVGVPEARVECLSAPSNDVLNRIADDHATGKLSDDDLAAIGDFAEYRKNKNK